MASWAVLLLLSASLRFSASPAHGLSSLRDDALFPNGTGVDRTSFPEGFLFGAITSSLKHEGAEFHDGKTDNIWDVYARKNGTTLDGSAPGQCGDNYNQYKGDHKLMSGMGMNAYRLSLAWSRIYPNGSGEVNLKAIAHYNDVIDSVIEEGLEPFVTLWTQDHPQILDTTYGGPLSRRFIDDFATYAETCFSAFGDRVKYWITFDEPNDWAGLGYATNLNAPGRCTAGILGYGDCEEGDSGTEPYIVTHHLLLAHAAAVEIYRNKYQVAQNGSIGIALWFRWSEPLTNTSADIGASERATAFLVRWYLDPILLGHYPLVMQDIVGSRLPSFTEEESVKVLGSLDFIGINVCTALYTFESNYSANATNYYLDQYMDATGFKDGQTIGEGSHDYAVPWSIRKAVEYIKFHYDNFPVYITQTGFGIDDAPLNETLNDDERVEYYETYYTELSNAIRDGANVKGVFAWSLIDGFEFSIGMYYRVGMYYVDPDLQRYPRKSALWFKTMLASNNSLLALKSS